VNTAIGIRHANHVESCIRKKLALTSPTSGGRSVGILRSRTLAAEFSFSVFVYGVGDVLWYHGDTEFRESQKASQPNVDTQMFLTIGFAYYWQTPWSRAPERLVFANVLRNSLPWKVHYQVLHNSAARSYPKPNEFSSDPTLFSLSKDRFETLLLSTLRFLK
jgi:hypothetical protein